MFFSTIARWIILSDELKCPVKSVVEFMTVIYESLEEESCCWLVRGSLFIELGCTRDLGKEWRGDLGTFMISRSI